MKHTILVALIVLAGLLVQGCGSSKGGPAGSRDEANLVIDNDDRFHSATVYVDGDKLGTIPSESFGHFTVVPGVRRIEIRHGNDLMPTVDYGTHDFTGGKVVRLTVDS